ncbi:chromosome partitioning protein, ParB family [Acetitomaculum ruminis DSM 5522]|uniref:Chromosome partitioning protein, ParB family n=1 Tax=Acetitomaculum ruminis DSM 5522 TaxID=1120918 RepID=A0A1I0ZAW3_9FIRM|nr:ParB/RepB/Spo0J family partition protein [Acetitomaculum ruminis]SFB22671.1 chromosome partitioning protein, ParB family [Acetitomaculum ruminis DSM 5522]
MPKKTKALGKGLDSLIPRVEDEEEKEVKVNKKTSEKKDALEIEINKIEPNKKQPRKNFDEDALAELSESIKQFGLIQPIVVRKIDKGYYEIIAGERRWRASKLAGLKKVPVIIKDYNELETMEISLIENIQRQDLNPVEEALAYKNLLENFNLKQDELAERVSKSRTAVTNSLRLLNLCEKVQAMLIDEMISTGHARALIPIEDEELQYELAQKIFDEKLSVRETEKLVKRIKKGEPQKPSKTPDNTYVEVEEKISGIFGSKVKVNGNTKGKGKIEIEYYSLDDFERIYDMLLSISRS